MAKTVIIIALRENIRTFSIVTFVNSKMMKLTKSTWILIFLALILGGWVYFYEIKGSEKRSQIETKQQQIFNFTEAEVQQIIITKPQEILEFVRTGNQNQTWQMKQPEDVPASDASIAFLLDLIAQGQRDRAFTIPSSNLSQYGLDDNSTKITIELNNQERHELIVGNSNLSDRFVYAQVNSLTNNHKTTQIETKVILVPKNWHYAVNRDLSEWKQVQSNPKASELEQ